RELVVILRDRQYDRDALAGLACFFRTRLPFWANPNGNKPRIQWGVPAPYPNINVITGAWIADTRALVASPGSLDVVRPPVGPGRYFQDGPYTGGWRGSRRGAWRRAARRATCISPTTVSCGRGFDTIRRPRRRSGSAC